MRLLVLIIGLLSFSARADIGLWFQEGEVAHLKEIKRARGTLNYTERCLDYAGWLRHGKVRLAEPEPQAVKRTLSGDRWNSSVVNRLYTEGDEIRARFIELEAEVAEGGPESKAVGARDALRERALEAWKYLLAPISQSDDDAGNKHLKTHIGIPSVWTVYVNPEPNFEELASLFSLSQIIFKGAAIGSTRELQILKRYIEGPWADELGYLNLSYPGLHSRLIARSATGSEVLKLLFDADYSKRKMFSARGLEIFGETSKARNQVLAGLLQGEAACRICHVETLDLSNNGITDDGVKLLARAIRRGYFPNLRHLLLSQSNLTYSGVRALNAAVKSAKIEVEIFDLRESLGRFFVPSIKFCGRLVARGRFNLDGMHPQLQLQ